jgi:hypothetical protein
MSGVLVGKADAAPARRMVYRVGQFWRGVRARVEPAEAQRAAELLPAQACALFRGMPVDAQRHSLDVLAALQAAGDVQSDLAAAALLHDVGKTAAPSLGLWLRGPLVLAEAFAPDLVDRWSDADPGRGWRYVLYVHRCHPAIGAMWAEQAGCSPLTCWLIAHHQDALDALDGVDEAAVAAGQSSPGQAPRALLAALQWADGRT